jgi:excisionase family DNA binding protein
MQATAFGHVCGRRGSNGLPKHYSIKSVATALEVSPRTVRRWIANGDLIAHRPGGLVRTVMCSPVHASQIAHALKLPRVSAVRRLEELIKHGYVERVGNAYRVTDKVNIPNCRTSCRGGSTC